MLLSAAIALILLSYLLSFPSKRHEYGSEVQVAAPELPWLGTLYFVGIYDRALPRKAVSRRYRHASNNTLEQRAIRGMVASYEPGEGRFKSRRPYSVELVRFDIVNANFQPLEDHGLEVNVSGLDQSTFSEKLVDKVRAGKELSIEMSFMPDSSSRNRSGRILKFSAGHQLLRFEVRQKETDLEVRASAPMPESAGARKSITARAKIAVNRKYHVIATYKLNRLKLFLDGREYSASSDTDHRVTPGIHATEASNSPPHL
jgi:hypothetical protein